MEPSPLSQNIAYAKLVLNTIKSVLEARNCPNDLPVRRLVSQSVCAGIEYDWVSSSTQQQARVMLPQSKTAFLASGLANIFDAADCGGRVVFPAQTNLIQGSRPRLLEQVR